LNEKFGENKEEGFSSIIVAYHGVAQSGKIVDLDWYYYMAAAINGSQNNLAVLKMHSLNYLHI
jgi:hypothetical protein